MSGIAHTDQIYGISKVNAHIHQTYLTEEFDKVGFSNYRPTIKRMNNHVKERSPTPANRADFKKFCVL